MTKKIIQKIKKFSLPTKIVIFLSILTLIAMFIIPIIFPTHTGITLNDSNYSQSIIGGTGGSIDISTNSPDININATNGDITIKAGDGGNATSTQK